MSRFSVGKLRAVLGVSFVGALLGGLLGGVVLGVSTILAPGVVPLRLFLGGTMAMASFGAYTFGAFGLLLAGTERAGELGDLSVPRSAALGVLAGASFPLVGALLTAGVLFPLEVEALSWLAGCFGVLGGGGAAGVVSVAKGVARAERGAQLVEGEFQPVLPEGGAEQ